MTILEFIEKADKLKAYQEQVTGRRHELICRIITMPQTGERFPIIEARDTGYGVDEIRPMAVPFPVDRTMAEPVVKS